MDERLIGRRSSALLHPGWSERGREIAAIFYTLLEAAKLQGLHPARFLRDAALGIDVALAPSLGARTRPG